MLVKTITWNGLERAESTSQSIPRSSTLILPSHLQLVFLVVLALQALWPKFCMYCSDTCYMDSPSQSSWFNLLWPCVTAYAVQLVKHCNSIPLNHKTQRYSPAGSPVVQGFKCSITVR
jgi:hypothetical protein